MGDYFNLPPLISVIILIIPFTAWLFGMLTRCKEGHYVAAIVRLFLGWIIWVCDLIYSILNGCNVQVLRILNF